MENLQSTNQTRNSQELTSQQLTLQFEQFQSVVFARMVQKVEIAGIGNNGQKMLLRLLNVILKELTIIIRMIEHKKAFENFSPDYKKISIQVSPSRSS